MGEVRVPRAARKVSISKEAIGRRVQLFRKSRGLTQAKLARALGTLQSNISDIERGARKPSLQQLLRLAQALRVSVDHIIAPEMPTPENGAAVTDRRFLERLHKIEKLSKRDKQALLKNIDMFLRGAGIS